MDRLIDSWVRLGASTHTYKLSRINPNPFISMFEKIKHQALAGGSNSAMPHHCGALTILTFSYRFSGV